MKINIWKYVKYLFTGYMWGRCFSSLYMIIDNPEEWPFLLLYAFLSIFFTTLDILEIKATEKNWFDTEEETSILGARVYGTKEEKEIED